MGKAPNMFVLLLLSVHFLGHTGVDLMPNWLYFGPAILVLPLIKVQTSLCLVQTLALLLAADCFLVTSYSGADKSGSERKKECCWRILCW